MSEQISILLYIKNMLIDLIYLNGVIATELIKVTENTDTIRRGEEFLDEKNCADYVIISLRDIIEKYKQNK